MSWQIHKINVACGVIALLGISQFVYFVVLACVSVSAIQSLTPRRLLVEKQARRYLEVIRRGYRKR